MNSRNKRWLEQRWDKRQPDRLEHIRQKKLERMKKHESKSETQADHPVHERP